MALFFNQMYESGPKAVISTCSQVISIKLSGGLSNSSGTLLCEHQDSFFKYIYPWEDVGGPEKDQVLLQAKEISMFFLHIFFLLGVCPLA